MKLHFLGTGSATPDPRRHNLSLLLEADDTAILVDCSSCPVQRIMATGCSLERLQTAILTHSHVDHIYGVPSLVHSLWLSEHFNNSRGLSVYGLRDTLGMARQLTSVFELESKRDPVVLDWCEIDPASEHRSSLDWDAFSINFFHVTHGTTPTIGLEVWGRKRGHVVFSGDAIVDESLRAVVRKGTHILIQDCGAKLGPPKGHASAKDVNDLIRGTSISEVYLVHLPETTAAEEREILEIAQDGFSGSVHIPTDMDALNLRPIMV